MQWLTTTLYWYLYLLLGGLIFFPLTHRLLKQFSDGGYAFSKTVAILVVSYLIFVLATVRILPFARESIFLIAIICGIVNIRMNLDPIKELLRTNWWLILLEESLFLGCLIFWVYVRGQEPSLHGLEKFMDFGFINSIVRADYFPPKDIWLAGHSLNYYYFGHLTGAVLTKLTAIPSYLSYNLILAMIFALGVTQTFSLCFTLARKAVNMGTLRSLFMATLGAFIVNFGGNLHTIYAFTTGYQGEKPVPFWQILSKYNPSQYWYPNATRFIPFTIHEFPIYSYVVADLHGHVFDIPFVLLTIAMLTTFFLGTSIERLGLDKKTQSSNVKTQIKNSKFKIGEILNTKHSILHTVVLGFLTSIHYMTNAFDGPIYLLLIIFVFLAIYRLSAAFFTRLAVLGISFVIFGLPFTAFFHPFASRIGVNCAPTFLTNIGKLGPFLFEKGNCQIDPVWMLVTLWGFFWFNFLFYVFYLLQRKPAGNRELTTEHFMLILFIFGTALLIIPEFFYIKDIYPAHFRANTMFKLGYQAFIMMGIASTFVFATFKKNFWKNVTLSSSYFVGFIVVFGLVAIYPKFAIYSYYGSLQKTPLLDGTTWVVDSYPDYKQIIDYLQNNVKGQPTILEAQGDSYTDYNLVSSYTGLPTVAGWWVHEWLWRGDSSVVANLIPDIQSLYQSDDIGLTKALIQKYDIKYVVIGPNERKKYTSLVESKFATIGKKIITTPTNASLYEIQ